METEVKKTKGRFTVCKTCKHEFKISEELKEQWNLLQNPCPNCKTLNCTLPLSEKHLQELQRIYYTNGKKEKDLGNMYEFMLKYSKSICIKLLGKLIKDEDEVEYFSHKATWKTIEQFIRTDRRDGLDFKINSSFGGYIAYKLKESFFEKDEFGTGSESIDDLNVFNETFENHAMSRYDFSVECSHIKQVEKDIFIPEIQNEILIYFNSINGELKLLVAILNFFKSGEKKSNLIFQNFGNEGKSRFLYVIKQFRNKLSTQKFST